MYDVVALGELLIDFIQNGNSSNGNPVFEANPGGAPCNVLSMLTGLGYKTAFIGKVGDDYFGKMLGNTIKRIGISDKGLIYDKEVNTTLAIVHTMEDGDRDFQRLRTYSTELRHSRQQRQTISLRLVEVPPWIRQRRSELLLPIRNLRM